MLAIATSVLPWNWLSIHDYELESSLSKPKPKKKAPIRTRAQQLVATSDSRPGAFSTKPEKSAFYPGLVNISGTYCFMNSTMQALASLSYLRPHIDGIYFKAEAVDVPTPVVDALRDLLHELNNPSSHYRSIRPVNMIAALSHPEPGRRSPLFLSREHQDAQELFQLVSEYIKKEATTVDREGARDLGFGSLGSLSSSIAPSTGLDVSKGVFDGLTANRRSCCECGYTEAVMHFLFDNWQLTVPPSQASCRLEDCLMDYTRLEVLTDCICRKCSMRATLRRLEQDVERLTAEAAKSSVSQSKKKRVREARRLALRLKTALEEGRIEEDVKGVKIEKVISRASTKQAMVARPPPVLALHLNRSVHFGAYASKNSARVQFPEVLDLTPFTTSGMLSTSPSFPISSHIPSATASLVTTLTTKAHNLLPQPPRVLYRLAAVVCHYGQHSFGHYVCYRRKPWGAERIVPPRLDEPPAGPGKGWLRASDDAVREVGIEAVLQEGSGAFMLFYERVRNEEKDEPPIGSPRSGAEDEGGETRTHRLQGALKRESDEEEERMEGQGQGQTPVIKARVVRSVSLGLEDDVEGASLSASVTVKQEAVDLDDVEARSLSSLRAPAETERTEVEAKPTVEAPTSTIPPDTSPSIPDAPLVDDPPIAVVDLGE
ncbi:hypothetical protein F5148DRAFT_980283 [Russula earlei]|uniref:Uncharacterized protein n=1 Tax=Russula earlei TaxID=71964 RepID=A0ACC0UA92_9AGAM|nr:hypothetical protein F5148DRAFT_980283 [Russula earlei]